MTKERRLAIQMWEEIVNKCKAGDDFSITSYKYDFCKEHNLDWKYSCYLCQYCRSCSNCPIGNCMLIYPKVCLEHDVALATVILNTIKGIDK